MHSKRRMEACWRGGCPARCGLQSSRRARQERPCCSTSSKTMIPGHGAKQPEPWNSSMSEIELPSGPPGPWATVCELVDVLPADWVLIGGLMVQIHAWERGVTDVRATVDVDVLGQARPPGALSEIDAGTQARRLRGDGSRPGWLCASVRPRRTHRGR